LAALSPQCRACSNRFWPRLHIVLRLIVGKASAVKEALLVFLLHAHAASPPLPERRITGSTIAADPEAVAAPISPPAELPHMQQGSNRCAGTHSISVSAAMKASASSARRPPNQSPEQGWLPNTSTLPAYCAHAPLMSRSSAGRFTGAPGFSVRPIRQPLTYARSYLVATDV